VRNLWSKIGVGLALGLAVIIGLSLLADVRAVAAQVRTFRWVLAPAVLALTLFNYALRFVKWHFYIRRIGAVGIRWQDSLRIFVGGFPLALSPGKIAEPIKAIWLQQATGVPVARGIPVVVAERISDGLAVLLLSAFGVVAFPRYSAAFVAVLVLLLAVVAASQIRPVAVRLLALGERLPLVSRWMHHAREFYEGMYQVFGVRATLFAVALGMVSWLGEGVGFYLVLCGVGLPPSRELAAAAIFVLSFSTVVGAVSSLPGGLGAAEASIAGMLSLTQGTSAEVAAAATLLIRFFTLWFGVALGIGVWLISPRLLTFRLANRPAEGPP
jgi:glycosyltransferase 2 family protein